MTTSFYERFSGNQPIEAFSTDVVFTQFSKTTDDYQEDACTTDSNSDDCKYKQNVDKLYEMTDSKERSTKSLKDGDEKYSASVLDSINLGIGISIMLGAIYYMNQ
jgi:hypothetical protein